VGRLHELSLDYGQSNETQIHLSKYLDELGNKKDMKELDMSVAELLQHEIDHLDGILAIDLAIDKNSIIATEVYNKKKKMFNEQVDYVIVPTISQ